MRWETKTKEAPLWREEARVFFLRKRRERAEDTERRALLEGLGQTRSLIAQAYAGFNAAKDPDPDRVLCL